MKKLRRIAVLALVLSLLLPMAAPADAVTEDLETTVKQQIRAYADSIDQSNADEYAAVALAGHGMIGGGKKFSVGEDHALTATLMNSELLQAALIDGCTTAIRSMQQLDLVSLPYISGWYIWHASEYNFTLKAYSSAECEYESKDWNLATQSYTGKINGYDSSLEWIAGGTEAVVKIERIKTTEETATYEVVCKVLDRFDFATSGNGGFKDLISGIGALLFREFDWEATATLELTVPNSCTHSSGNYHWTYDTENKTLVSDGSGDYTVNGATCHNLENACYYELDETVRLYHDQPWVMEYEIKNPGRFALSPLEDYIPSTKPSLIHGKGDYLHVFHTEHITLSEELMEEYGRTNPSEVARNYYGTRLSDHFSYSSNRTYFYRLENKVNEDGGNMIYLTVQNAGTGEILVDKVPMDDHYRYETWVGKMVYQDDGSNWVSGKDLFINFIGNQIYPFSADYFDLRIWENGKDGEVERHCDSKIVGATCTTDGYTTYTCRLCGYAFQGDIVPSPGHSFSHWKVIRNPSYEAPGEKLRNCSVCGYIERVEIPKLEILPGDATGDGEIDGRDLILLRQSLAGWDVKLDETAADCNGDGEVNGKDLILLRQYLAGWDVTLG